MTSDTAPGGTARSGQDIVAINEVRVDRKVVLYTVGGTGPSVLFLHGWGLGHHAYRAGLRRLAHLGYHVIAPALPGFGGTPDLEPGNRTFVGYARWVTRFLKAADVRPAITVGHSFGGGVGIRLLADNVGLAQSLVLLNSVGGTWRTDGAGEHAMAERPIWDWGRAIPADVVGLLGGAASILPSVFQDLVPNVLRNPFGVAKVGRLARNADLLAALRMVADRRVPITVVHSDRDAVIPASSFESLCEAAKVEGRRVKGIHSWPLTSPALFAEIVDEAATPLRSPTFASA